MKQYIFIATIMYLMVNLVACQDKDNEYLEDGHGYLQISSVELDKTVIPKQMKMMRTTPERMALDIIKDGIIIKHLDDWTALQSENILLPVGQYILKAYSIDKDSTQQGVDALPYYLGQIPVSIEKDIAKSVEVVCGLAQSMVSISYSSNFKNAFSAYESIVTNEYGSITLTSDEVRPAYLRAGKALNSALSLTNTDGNIFIHNKQITEKAERRYHYKVNYDVTSEGTGNFTFTIDQTTREYEINITVPLPPTAPNEDPILRTTEANAWGKFAYMYGTVESNSVPQLVSFQYKELDEPDWISVEATLMDGKYVAKTNEIDFAKSYEYQISSGNNTGNTLTFTTESFVVIPNLDFNTWTKSGRNWHANPVANDNNTRGAYWATGNTGVTSWLAGSNDPITIPVDGADAYKGKAARLRTITGVTLVKSAAGNLLIGKYSTNALNPAASVTFGRPYSGARPVSLSGYYKYDPKTINEGTRPGHLTTDECHIYLKLWDASGVEIGYGEFIGAEAVNTYTKFSFDINYTSLTAKPASITIVATSSHYGGLFQGSQVVGQVGAGSTLWIDEFELSYYKE